MILFVLSCSGSFICTCAYISGDSLPVSSKTNLGSRAKSGYKKSRLSDRLKPELFEDEDNDSGDDALIHFNL